MCIRLLQRVFKISRHIEGHERAAGRSMPHWALPVERRVRVDWLSTARAAIANCFARLGLRLRMSLGLARYW